jgi:vitamin B12 transporter
MFFEMSATLVKRGRWAVACSSFFLFAAVSVSAAAQTVTEPIVVTGTREPLSAQRLAADVVVINSNTLQNTTADSLADLLRREAGLQISRSGGPGQSTGVLLRGASSQQTVLLVDGVRVGSATLGSAAFEALGLAQIERVEVLRGPGSSLYGADAVGGVVQVFTKAGKAGLQLEGRAAVGGLGAREFSGGLRGATGAFDYAASLATERSTGVSALREGDQFGNFNPDRDGHQLDTAHLRLGFKPAAGHRIGLTLLRTRLNSQYDASEYLAPNFEQDNRADFRTRLNTEVTALDWRGEYGPLLTGSAHASRSVDDASNGGTETDRFRTTREQLGAQLAWQIGGWGQVVGAVEHKTERATSTSYVAPAQRRTNALSGEWTGTVDDWSWQADARRDDSSDYGAATSGRVGGSYAIAPGLRLRALAGTTFRAPSFNDLLFPGYGVATLRPERGRSIELGLNWREDKTSASATFFNNKVRDLIGYESDRTRCPPDPGYDFGCAANVSRAQLQGLTLAGSQRHGDWAFNAQLDFLQARDENSGARLARRAAHQATVGVDWAAGDWAAGASVLRLGARPDGGKSLAAETTLNLTARWQLAPAWQLQSKLLNATDTRIEPARDYQGLGRQAWLVLKWEPVL